MARMATTLLRQVQVLVDQQMTPAQIGERVAVAARANLADLISRGLASPVYDQYVDGAQDRPLQNVRLDGGTIRFVFDRLAEAAAFAVSYVRTLSPQGPTGEYARAWIVVVNGVVWTGPIEQIPLTATEVIITNFAPFARRLEESFARKGHPSLRVTEIALAPIRRKFPGFKVRRRYISIPGPATGKWQVPYIRKLPPGGPILYPAIVITQVMH